MEEERAADDIHSKYEELNNIHQLFSYLYDHRLEDVSDTYTKQTELIEIIDDFWPVIVDLCNNFKIPLVVSAQDVENLFHGFDAAAIEKLSKLRRYVNIPIKKMIALEEELLIHLIKSIFDKLLARLKKEIKKLSNRNIQPPKTYFEPAPVSCESLSDTDINILQAMNKNPQKSMIRVEIEEASGHQKFAVMNSLKRLQAAGMVSKAANKRKGWVITEKGISTAAKLK
jgi:hypothetical protein